ncbi:hypothetical protein [Natrialba sp. SSL1]|uniref:hypothetical protein n=1 Tax=Natrialba sp. SSL1 TaxID=1869245 RepID=UPI0008F95F04|nr:hypothetical protein [Natrialba sp. SSL1]OIB56361.1 hypothetical protein BBD46_18585 [Natrialba sp. SSL1]
MRQLAALLLVALLVMSAGCSAFDSSPNGDRDPLTAESDELVPGLTEDGINDTTAFANAHYDALEYNEFERTEQQVRHNESGEVIRTTNTTQTVTEDAASYVLQVDPDSLADPEPDTEMTRETWREDGDQMSITRVTDAAGTIEFHGQNMGMESTSLPVSVYELSELEHTVSIDESDSGAERYRIEGAGNTTQHSDQYVEFDLLVDSSGLIQTYEISQTMSVDSEEQTWESVGEFTRDDDLELEEPDWVEDGWEELESQSAED